MSFNFSRSADSGSKSKRSFNSISSNPSSDNSNSKKKEATQKTLGMTWGSNSRYSSRSSFLNSPFSDFGRSFAVKLYRQSNRSKSTVLRQFYLKQFHFSPQINSSSLWLSATHQNPRSPSQAIAPQPTLRATTLTILSHLPNDLRLQSTIESSSA
ncbi:ATP-dependent DNA helicase [Actinidia chinensis var. chinensis]|uniref:ATP-dependent DNA helicase n=1 Tax=Actinidia chinensis var. chinensis TaxID=1590841 RepID=A0A2R6R443_ACTCC|nr:ATP-dependent DNA helicase [Actinidia chinensis var. chinensis]